MSLYFCFSEVHRWTDKEIKNIIRDVFGHSVLVKECKRQWISHQGLNTFSKQHKTGVHPRSNFWHTLYSFSSTQLQFFCIVFRINSIHSHKKNLFKSCKKLLRPDAIFFFLWILKLHQEWMLSFLYHLILMYSAFHVLAFN